MTTTNGDTGPIAIATGEMIAIPATWKPRKPTFGLQNHSTYLDKPNSSAVRSVKTATCQSRRSDETSLHQAALMCNNAPWFERIGTARQFAPAQVSVVPTTGRILAIHDARTMISTIVGTDIVQQQ
jgi:hypothetical protein